ncbi:MAG: hypothetical protein WA635_10680 [Gallionella sp.]
MKKILGILAVMVLVLMVATAAQAGAVLADVGADSMLTSFFNGTAPGNLTLKLFCTNTTPADTDINTTYTECAGGNYSAKTLTQGSWTITVANDPSDAVYADQVFSFTGALTTNGTIYGYYVLAGSVLVGSETLATPFTPNAGYSLTITPKFKLSKGTPN